jgi:hypothetical protein
MVEFSLLLQWSSVPLVPMVLGLAIGHPQSFLAFWMFWLASTWGCTGFWAFLFTGIGFVFSRDLFLCVVQERDDAWLGCCFGVCFYMMMSGVVGSMGQGGGRHSLDGGWL